MTTHTNLKAYLERPYLSGEYLKSDQHAVDGMQINFVIESAKQTGMQAESTIEADKDTGMQVEFTIEADKDTGMQTEFSIIADGDDSFNAMQSNFDIEGTFKLSGVQTNFVIEDTEKLAAMEFKADSLSHKLHSSYLNTPYLQNPYLSSYMCAFMGMQMEFFIVGKDFTAMQNEFNIIGPDDDSFNGMQTKFTMTGVLDYLGMQVDFAQVAATGMQFLATLYNTTNLRILCTFLSRGNPEATGTNAWGNDAGVGKNWKANVVTDTGPDKNIENLNTDVVVQTWQAATAKSGINLDCDTELTQGVFLDTLAILNHNLTKSASVQLFGSNDSSFGTIGVTRVLTLIDEPNIYHIEENLPITGYRYWRVSIDDSTNSDTVEIGTIVFGASSVFSGECITDNIDLENKDFADTVNTEGFTNIANSRAQKKIVGLDFKSLGFTQGNYGILKAIFQEKRTTLKCLWIPTPDINDAEFTARFAAFSKIDKIPKERHNSKGPKYDFASFGLTLDESK